jgi:hypothetical protein
MNQQAQQQYREFMLNLREQNLGERAREFNTAEDRRQQESADKRANYQEKIKEHEQTAQRLQQSAQQAIATRNVQQIERTIADFDRLISRRQFDAAQGTGAPLPPEESTAMYNARQKLVEQRDRLIQQNQQNQPASFQDRFAPPGSGMPKGAPPIREVPPGQ